jgi:hypothetical protein
LPENAERIPDNRKRKKLYEYKSKKGDNKHQVEGINSIYFSNYGALVRKRNTPTERPPLVGEVRANFNG